jgi:tetratricopeptide (TPR) repeat protein
MRVAEIQSKLGESALAEAGYGAALEIFKRLSNEFPDSHEYRHDVAACYQALQNVLREANRLAEAEVACRKALALQERLVLEAPQIPDYRKDLADNMNCLALLYRESGKVDDAKETLETAMGQYSRLIQEFPTEPEYRYGQANLLNSLGIMLATKGGERDAERAWREALSLLQGLPLDFTDMLGQRQRVIQVSGNLSHVLSDPAEILELRREVVAGYDELVRDFPRVLMHRRNLAVRLNDLAVAHKEMDQPSEADAAFRRAMEIQEKLAAESTVSPEVREELAGTLMNFVGFLHDSGRATDAEQLEVRAV